MCQAREPTMPAIAFIVAAMREEIARRRLTHFRHDGFCAVGSGGLDQLYECRNRQNASLTIMFSLDLPGDLLPTTKTNGTFH